MHCVKGLRIRSLQTHHYDCQMTSQSEENSYIYSKPIWSQRENSLNTVKHVMGKVTILEILAINFSKKSPVSASVSHFPENDISGN